MRHAVALIDGLPMRAASFCRVFRSAGGIEPPRPAGRLICRFAALLCVCVLACGRVQPVVRLLPFRRTPSPFYVPALLRVLPLPIRARLVRAPIVARTPSGYPRGAAFNASTRKKQPATTRAAPREVPCALICMG